MNVKSNIPWYIIPADNKALNAFKIFMGIVSVPSLIINLYFIAFGWSTEEGSTSFIVLRVVEYLEILFMLEII